MKKKKILKAVALLVALLIALFVIDRTLDTGHEVDEPQESPSLETEEETSAPEPVTQEETREPEGSSEEETATETKSHVMEGWIPGTTIELDINRLPDTMPPVEYATPEAHLSEQVQTILRLWTPPDYSGEDYAVINGDKTFFSDADYATQGIVTSELDYIRRAGPVIVMVKPDAIQEAEADGGWYTPTGWHQTRYEGLVTENSGYLMTRINLAMYNFSGLTNEPTNIIAGTEYLNRVLLRPLQTRVFEYVRDTGDSCLYRATPYFKGDDAFATGILVEAESMEDGGLSLCRFLYNIQPGISISYATGENWPTDAESASYEVRSQKRDYEIDYDTKEFHYPWCSRTFLIRRPMSMTASRITLINAGYIPCPVCKP